VFRRAVPAPDSLLPIFDRPDIVQGVFPQFASYLPVSQRARQQIIDSEDIQIALCELDEALKKDSSRAIVKGLGLPDNAGDNMASFLDAITPQPTVAGTGD
jgi:hypothetical protein